MGKNNSGYTATDIIGIALMIIPFLISLFWRGVKYHLLFIPEDLDILPDLMSAFVICILFVGLSARYNIFRKDTIKDIIISIIRAFLDIWVFSSLLSIVFPDSEWQLVVLITSILFTYLGIRSLAAYGWVIVVFLSLFHFLDVNEAMGPIGAIFIIFLTISMMLQVKNISDISNFLQEFKGVTDKVGLNGQNYHQQNNFIPPQQGMGNYPPPGTMPPPSGTNNNPYLNNGGKPDCYMG